MLLKDNLSFDFGTINSLSTTTVVTPMAGALTTDVVTASLVSLIADPNLIVSRVRVPSAGNVAISMYNPTGGNVVVGALSFNVALQRL